MRFRIAVALPGADDDPARAAAPVRVLEVEAERGRTLNDLLLALGWLGPAGSAATVDGHLLDPGTPLGMPPLVDGAVLALSNSTRRAPVRAHAGTPRDGAVPELVVTSGPNAGSVHPVGLGRHRIGRSPGLEVRVDDAALSRVHAIVTVAASGVWIHDRSTNGTWVDGVRVGRRGLPVWPGQLITLGRTRLRLRVPEHRTGRPPRAALHATGEATIEVGRSPRLRPLSTPVAITLPSPPADETQRSIPWAPLLLPLPVAAILAATLGPHMLLIGAAGPLMVLATALADRRSRGRARRRALSRYAEQLADAREEIAVALARERRSRVEAHPDAADVLDIATGPGHRLWERRGPDLARLELRVGTGSAPSRVRVTSGDRVDAPVLHEVPVTVPLGDIGVLGIWGPTPIRAGVARHLLGQLATWYSPRDLEVWVVSSAPGQATWEWASWLPHLRANPSDPRSVRWGCVATPTDGRPRGAWPAAMSGGDGDDPARDVLADLDTLLLAREASRRSAVEPGSRHVVLLDIPGSALRHPTVKRALGAGPAAGVHVIALAPATADLPLECEAVIGIPASGELGRLHVDGATPSAVLADVVSSAWAERLALGLAPLRDGTRDVAADLPERVGLVEVLGLDPDDPAHVAARWAVRDGMAAVVGVGSEGPVRVDLEADGPHMLVGGTTGSGKSEFLQTLVISLALTSPPEDLSFVLVDYKGGSAFADCARLPHTVGLVTDLDPHLTSRALTSLRAELRRRETLLREAGATDVDDYRRRRGERVPIARLLLVIDEFRSLAEEMPDFLDGLVRIAATGRSLGIHLVLATQRPAGIVSADVTANVNLRVALRVRDRADSHDVVDGPEAAEIDQRTPGRAVARVGGRPLLRFQTAWVGGRTPTGGRSPGVRVTPVDAPGAGAARGRSVRGRSMADCTPPGSAAPAGTQTDRPEPDAPAGTQGPTDLTRLVDSIRTAASRLGSGPPHVPWLPPLPALVRCRDLPAARSVGVPWGLVDLPDGQTREALTWDPETGSHWAVTGAPRSGRTTALRTLAGAAAEALPPERLHLYAVDASGGLSGLGALPHTGAVVPYDDAGRLARLVARLTSEVGRRQALLAELGHADLSEWRRDGGDPPAHLLVLVDGWEQVQQACEDAGQAAVLENLIALARDGVAAGVRLVAAGGRSLLLGRAAALFGERLALRVIDPGDAALLGLVHPHDPAHLPPGRAVRLADRSEVQLAVLGTDPAAATQARALARLAACAPSRWHDAAPCARPDAALPAAADEGTTTLHSASNGRTGLPFRIDALPRRVRLCDIDGQHGPEALTVGVGGDELAPVRLDLSRDGRHLVVCGPSGSGRTTTLATLAQAALRGGLPVAAVTASPPDGPLEALGNSPGVVTSITGAVGCADASALVDARRRHPDLVVVVDDADLLLDTPIEDVLRRMVADLDGGRGAFVVSGTTSSLATQFRGLGVEVARRRTGIVLCPRSTTDADVLGAGRVRTTAATPGRGLLVRRGRVEDVQVALPAGLSPGP